MNNHIHLIWQVRQAHQLNNVQRDFLKFTAQQFRFDLINKGASTLKDFKVKLKDRRYQFWKRASLNVPLYSTKVFEQKLDYIHQNPVKEGLAKLPENYRYSSASFYLLDDVRYDFLTHYSS
ncbi:MAG: transposase [Fulvivirga sp.]|uniref:transposase n=1 Tax=Fulvivirga sp. TaxID=1931237 RepID=UPI0032EB4AAF